jgi:Inner membrane protein YgaP-like, transmembrane domain
MNTTTWKFGHVPNVGNVDKVVRYVAGAILIGITLAISPENMGWTVLLALISIPIVISAIIGWDPLYALFQKRPNSGIESFKTKQPYSAKI